MLWTQGTRSICWLDTIYALLFSRTVAFCSLWLTDVCKSRAMILGGRLAVSLEKLRRGRVLPEGPWSRKSERRSVGYVGASAASDESAGAVPVARYLGRVYKHPNRWVGRSASRSHGCSCVSTGPD